MVRRKPMFEKIASSKFATSGLRSEPLDLSNRPVQTQALLTSGQRLPVITAPLLQHPTAANERREIIFAPQRFEKRLALLIKFQRQVFVVLLQIEVAHFHERPSQTKFAP